MATFVQNIKNIRGEAVYGPDVRESIAEAITQAIDLDISGDDMVFVTLTEIVESPDDFLLSFSNQQ